MACLAPSFQFRTADLAAAAGVVVATALVISLRNDSSDLQVLASGVDRHESQVGGSDVLRGVCDVVLHVNFYADFHRGLEDAIDRRTQDYEIADAHGYEEV